MTFGTTLGKHLTLAASANMFYVAIAYKNKNMKVVASNINIKTRQLFSKQRILSACVTTAQRNISGDLKRTCF